MCSITHRNSNRRLKLVYGLAACALAAFAAGVGCDRSTSTVPKVHVEISNATDSKLTEATVHFGQNRCFFGVLVSGGEATHLLYDWPITEKAAVKWTDSRGNTVERTANVSQSYDLKQSGTLRFQIESNDVKVLFVPEKE